MRFCMWANYKATEYGTGEVWFDSVEAAERWVKGLKRGYHVHPRAMANLEAARTAD